MTAPLTARMNLLKWTGDEYAGKVFGKDGPDRTIIESLALEHLASQLPTDPDPTCIRVRLFHKGTFSLLYSISYVGLGSPAQYLLRVALPLVPYYKTESEAAVLSYLREKTSIPVPRVIAWESSAENALGFEWILFEQMEGDALKDVWWTMPWESKIEFVVALASLMGQLRDHKFVRIGSLYFKGRESQSERQQGKDTVVRLTEAVSQAKHLAAERNTIVEEASESNCYTVGQLLKPSFYLNRRLYLPGNRGPFRTSREWMTAEIDFQTGWIRTTPSVITSAPAMEKLCQKYQSVLAKAFDNAGEASSYVLHHNLSRASILVDPCTFEIEGIVDWETIQVVPEWKSSRFPEFLASQADFDAIDDQEPRIPTSTEYDEDSEDYNSAPVLRRDQWETMVLRRHYDVALSRTTNENSRSGYDSHPAGWKRELEAGIMNITQTRSQASDILDQYVKSKEQVAGKC